jgi:hypothetical protein
MSYESVTPDSYYRPLNNVVRRLRETVVCA